MKLKEIPTTYILITNLPNIFTLKEDLIKLFDFTQNE